MGDLSLIRRASWPPAAATKLLPLRGNTKQAFRAFNNVKITLLCGFVTILVLRGTIGFGNPPRDTLLDVRNGLSLNSRDVSRVLSEITDQEDEEDGEEQEADDAAEGEVALDRILAPNVTDWDSQRQAWMLENTDLMSPAPPRVLLVTGSAPCPCHNSVGDHYLLKFLKNKMDYCRLHDLEIFYNLAHMSPGLAGCWSKLPVLHALMLGHPEVEWLWWMDSDAMFTDMAFELPLDKYREHNLIVYGQEDEVYSKRSWVGLNAGSFLLRNCQWSLDILDAWALMGQKGKVREAVGKVLSEILVGRPTFEADDQSALIYLLITQKHLWKSKVYMENSYYLQGYWFAMLEMLDVIAEEDSWGNGTQQRPFVTHFVGCKACDRYGDYSVEKCMRGMERAFNFGDNQVLRLYGFQHSSLGTFDVEKYNNETDNPLGTEH